MWRRTGAAGRKIGGEMRREILLPVLILHILNIHTIMHDRYV